ncbi:MAG: AAA family ATPase [Thermodesulfobacteriota bacterium]
MRRILRLDLRGFRGVRKDIPLIFNGKSILLFGENGTGKSSFIDALEKLFTGQVSTLDGSSQGLSSERHGPHIRNGDNPPRIAVTFDDSASTVFTQGSTLESLPSEIQKYVDSARENLYILRRRQILHFIDSQPRDRYALLRPFLLLSGVEAMENELQRARESAEADTQQAKQGFDRFVDQLWRELGLPRSSQVPSEENVLEVVSQCLERAGQARINRSQDFDVALGGIDTALAPFGDLTRQTQISNSERGLQQLIERISSLSLDQLLATVEELRQLEAQEGRIFYETVLEQGIRWIQEEERSTCPLCENRINPEETANHIRQRLEAMQQVVDLRRRAQEKGSSLLFTSLINSPIIF